jgi:hypothetical protein
MTNLPLAYTIKCLLKQPQIRRAPQQLVLGEGVDIFAQALNTPPVLTFIEMGERSVEKTQSQHNLYTAHLETTPCSPKLFEQDSP